MVTGRTQKQVTEVLNTLQDAYDSFSIHQSSVSVDRETYERVAQRSEHGTVEVDVKVRHEDGVLVCETDGAERTPHGLIDVDDAAIETAARHLVRERTGVSCHVVDLVSANIVAVHDATTPDRDPVYRLSVSFEAVYETGEPAECASWHASNTQAAATHPLLE
ncbi:hypothetical protein [Halocatena salina]|uniref:Uncharacterized protein n=1 Tax=Halocatena salina TaxID=2934340 RepID=A0A8U0A5D8_9EURY|nr:hypothetical protein [Halocatena salina]UPM43688.1 hypothetical protein MW046_04375 [Halocatena salina]